MCPSTFKCFCVFWLDNKDAKLFLQGALRSMGLPQIGPQCSSQTLIQNHKYFTDWLARATKTSLSGKPKPLIFMTLQTSNGQSLRVHPCNCVKQTSSSDRLPHSRTLFAALFTPCCWNKIHWVHWAVTEGKLAATQGSAMSAPTNATARGQGSVQTSVELSNSTSQE